MSKEDFKDLKRWDLSDHKYVIKAIVDNSKPDELPLLQSSLTIIAESLKVIIEDLKKNFVNDLDRSVFITFYHKSFSKWGILLVSFLHWIQNIFYENRSQKKEINLLSPQ